MLPVQQEVTTRAVYVDTSADGRSARFRHTVATSDTDTTFVKTRFPFPRFLCGADFRGQR